MSDDPRDSVQPADMPRPPEGATCPGPAPDQVRPAAADKPPPPQPSTCPLCGTALAGRHCKLICPNCGYTEDCSDLFPA